MIKTFYTYFILSNVLHTWVVYRIYFRLIIRNSWYLALLMNKLGRNLHMSSLPSKFSGGLRFLFAYTVTYWYASIVTKLNETLNFFCVTVPYWLWYVNLFFILNLPYHHFLYKLRTLYESYILRIHKCFPDFHRLNLSVCADHSRLARLEIPYS